jgi:hypothetical protein
LYKQFAIHHDKEPPAGAKPVAGGVRGYNKKQHFKPNSQKKIAISVRMFLPT